MLLRPMKKVLGCLATAAHESTMGHARTTSNYQTILSSLSIYNIKVETIEFFFIKIRSTIPLTKIPLVSPKSLIKEGTDP